MRKVRMGILCQRRRRLRQGVVWRRRRAGKNEVNVVFHRRLRGV